MQILPADKHDNGEDKAGNPASPLVCDLTAFTAEERQHHMSATQMLFASRLETLELAYGYALRFAFSIATAVALGEFMALEHLCCPFFRLTMEIEPEQNTIWLRLAGGDPIKQFIQAEMHLA